MGTHINEINSTSVKSLYANVLPIFARHETFHPRFGWLKKGFDKTVADGKVFLQDNAPITLGVGKNMVRAIRYWCNAFKIIEENATTRNSLPTSFGLSLLGEDGWDPYLEDLASLWLLHWNLIKRPSYATTWYFVFNEYHHLEFTSDELLNALISFRERVFPSQKIVEASLSKDVSCLLRMYVKRNVNKGLLEDSIDSPFSDLTLIQSAGDSNRFFYKIGDKPGLVSEIIVAACLEFAANSEEGGTTTSISRLLYDVGSPGLIFKLSESSLCGAIEAVASTRLDIYLSESSGLLQFVYTRNPETIANEILDRYYRERR
jgi:hypothetical protein